MRLDETARGVFVIAVTPFDEEGNVDRTACEPMVEFYLSRGVDGLTILGMMGEAPKLDAEEAVDFAKDVIARVDGRVPVVVGVSSPGLASTKRLAHEAMIAGAAGVMVAPPKGLRGGDRAIVGHFERVAEALGPDIPFVLQDYPLALDVVIPVSVIAEIVRTIPSCVVLKHEDWPGLDKIGDLRTLEAEGQRRIGVLCGNGGLFLPEELDRGADGAMTGFAYPEMMVEVCRLHRAGESEAARDLFDLYLPLVRYEQQPGLGLAVRKHVLKERGALHHATLRTPAPRLTGATLEEVARLRRRLEARWASPA